MKFLPPLLACACALPCPGWAAPKPAGAKKPAYPGIIQMTPPGGAPAAEGGALISTEISGLDLRCLREACAAGLLLSEIGALAKTRSQTDHVRKLAAALAATQSEENEQLGRLAARKGVVVSPEAAAVRARSMAELEAQAGLKFDKAVLEEIVAVNRLSVSAYEAGSNSQDPEIKSFVSQMLPVAKARLQLTSKMAGAPAQSSGVPQFRTSTPPPGR